MRNNSGTASHIFTIILAIILGGLAYFLCFSAEGPGYALPKHERIYNICMQNVKKSPSDGGIPFAEIVASATQDVGCKAMSELCKKLPDSCDNILEKITKMQ